MAMHSHQMTALYGRWLTSVWLQVNLSAPFSQYGYCIDRLYSGWLTALTYIGYTLKLISISFSDQLM